MKKPLVEKTVCRMILPALLLVGCNWSPLLDHAYARGAGQGDLNALEDQDKSACPLLFERQGLCASLTWAQAPASEELGQFTLRFWKKDEATDAGPYADPGLALAVKLWMPSMGHGSSPVKIAPAVDEQGVPVPGVYQVTDVYFVMPGKWEIWVQLKNGAAVVDQAKYDVKL